MTVPGHRGDIRKALSDAWRHRQRRDRWRRADCRCPQRRRRELAKHPRVLSVSADALVRRFGAGRTRNTRLQPSGRPAPGDDSTPCTGARGVVDQRAPPDARPEQRRGPGQRQRRRRRRRADRFGDVAERGSPAVAYRGLLRLHEPVERPADAAGAVRRLRARHARGRPARQRRRAVELRVPGRRAGGQVRRAEGARRAGPGHDEHGDQGDRVRHRAQSPRSPSRSSTCRSVTPFTRRRSSTRSCRPSSAPVSGRHRGGRRGRQQRAGSERRRRVRLHRHQLARQRALVHHGRRGRLEEYRLRATATRSPAFSSRGPTWFDALAKPDVVAPGVHLVSNTDTSSYLYTNLANNRQTVNGHPNARPERHEHGGSDCGGRRCAGARRERRA